MLKTLIIISAIGVFAYFAYQNFNGAFGQDRERVTQCPIGFHICPNWHVVGRSGPNCSYDCTQ